MTEGTRNEPVEEISQVKPEIQEARAELNKATFEAPAKVEALNVQDAEKVQEEFTALVDNLPDSPRMEAIDQVSPVSQIAETTSGDVLSGADPDQSQTDDENEPSGLSLDADAGLSAGAGLSASAGVSAGVSDEPGDGAGISLDTGVGLGASAGMDSGLSAGVGVDAESSEGTEEGTGISLDAGISMGAGVGFSASAGDSEGDPNSEDEPYDDPLDDIGGAQVGVDLSGLDLSEGEGENKQDPTKDNSLTSSGIETLIAVSEAKAQAAEKEAQEIAGKQQELNEEKKEVRNLQSDLKDMVTDHDPGQPEGLTIDPTREVEAEESSEHQGQDSTAAAGKAGLSAQSSDPARSYGGVELAQGAVAQDSDWNEGSLGGKEPEEPISAREDFESGGSQELKNLLVPFRNNLGALREFVAELATGEDDPGVQITPTSSGTIGFTEIQTIADVDQDALESMLGSLSDSEQEMEENAGHVSTFRDAVGDLREESSMLQDELSDWPDDGSTREITYTEWEPNEDGSFSPKELTKTMTKDEAKSLATSMQNQITSMSGSGNSEQEEWVIEHSPGNWQAAAIAAGIENPLREGSILVTEDSSQEGTNPLPEGTEQNLENNSEIGELILNYQMTLPQIEIEIAILNGAVENWNENMNVMALGYRIAEKQPDDSYNMIGKTAALTKSQVLDLIHEMEFIRSTIHLEIQDLNAQLSPAGDESESSGPTSADGETPVQSGQGGGWQDDAYGNAIEDPNQ